jgi:hypothetical protein
VGAVNGDRDVDFLVELKEVVAMYILKILQTVK